MVDHVRTCPPSLVQATLVNSISGVNHTQTITNPLGLLDVASYIASNNDLVGIPGNHEVTLDWDAYPSATSYKIERADPSNTYTGYVQIASGVTATTYVDDEQTWEYGDFLGSGYTGGTLILGMLYEYRVIPVVGGVDQTPLGPVSVRPDDGLSLANWTSIAGSTRRDCRNVGHWRHSGLSVVGGTANLTPGTFNDTVFTGQVRLNNQGTYVFNRCWIQGLFNDAGEPTVSDITVTDCTVGPPRGYGSNSSQYEANGLFGGNGGDITASRCHFFHGGSQVFTHISGPNQFHDCFFNDMSSPDYTVDPHCDAIWHQSSSSVTSIRRCHFDNCGKGTSSQIGPGTSNSGGDVLDCLFNAGSAHGTLVLSPGVTTTGNRWKRWPTGGWVDPDDGNNPINTFASSSRSDCKWIDFNGSTWNDAEDV